MAESVRLDSLDAVPEALRALAVEVQGEGGVTQYEFRPPSTKTDDDVARVKTALAKERERAKQLTEQLNSRSSKVTIDDEELELDELRTAVQAFRQLQQQQQQGKPDLEKEWESRKAKVVAPLQKQLTELEAQLKARDAELDRAIVDTGIAAAATGADAPVRFRDVEDVRDFIRDRNLARRNGTKIEVYELDGTTPLINSKGDPGTLADLLALIATKKPHWVQDSQGAGAQPSVNGASVRMRRSEMSLDQKIEFIKKNGEDKYASLPH